MIFKNTNSYTVKLNLKNKEKIFSLEETEISIHLTAVYKHLDHEMPKYGTTTQKTERYDVKIEIDTLDIEFSGKSTQRCHAGLQIKQR